MDGTPSSDTKSTSTDDLDSEQTTYTKEISKINKQNICH